MILVNILIQGIIYDMFKHIVHKYLRKRKLKQMGKEKGFKNNTCFLCLSAYPLCVLVIRCKGDT